MPTNSVPSAPLTLNLFQNKTAASAETDRRYLFSFVIPASLSGDMNFHLQRA